MKLEGAWGPKIGVKLNAAMLRKFRRGDCFPPGTSPPVQELRRRTTDVLKNCFVFVSVSYIAE